ncbi:MAG TPA: transcription-repair coupling factor [Verrucomicrobiae bacterium]|nr:transcription-repair coupling factor [Verrucomicrobiae bacterium]
MQDLFRALEKGGALPVSGVPPAAQAFLVAMIRRRFPDRAIVVVADGLKSQESLQQDIETWLPKPLFFPAWEVFPHESKLPHVDVISDRLETLMGLSENPSSVLVTTPVALLQKTYPPSVVAENTKRFKRGEQADPMQLAEWLQSQGYEVEAQVNHKGEFSLRGGILDVFPPTAPWPIRLEFFGDDLDSLRSFDPITQVSRGTLGEAVIPPAGELALLKKLGKSATLLEHLPEDTVFILPEPDRLSAVAAEYEAELPEDPPLSVRWRTVLNDLRTRLELLQTNPLWTAVAERSGDTALDSPPVTAATAQVPGLIDLGFSTLDPFRPITDRAPEPHVGELQRREFFTQMHRWLRQSYQLQVFCNNDGERQRFREIWQEYGLGFIPADRSVDSRSADDPLPDLRIGALSRGFMHEAGKLVVVTDAEIFGRYKVQRPRRLKAAHAQTTRSLLHIDFTDLEDGDYVVHVEHGIGRYVGLSTLSPGSGTKPLEKAGLSLEGGEECLVIEFAPSNPEDAPPKLYVPVSEAHLVSKYVGAGKVRPPLNTLGGARWTKTKEAAERAVRDLASELLSIQAARESQAGLSFPPDAPWQREFESSFIFEETPDQMKAIQATKLDMERSKPMDRLICGDVGFGKTEVAIRAAFKAVMGGKQVAVLVPTTVLAQQHFNTFRERMADYPVRIELLSRFRTPREQKRVIQDLAAGSVDIVIGTHRLIQSDIAFKDLGLVIVDEEQRFGVMHKEKFKLLRKMVDVLTLSATPIPRTLYLALTGARDMSTIETPPQDRLPVETIVSQYDERLIRDAINRELARQGQVFYLHNRVMDIDAVAGKLRALLPRARIVVGHGQMDADELEEVMTQFVNGEADVLLSTTIIESGLDIPNANTIIIDRADRFGLSDLYQLRGRVGRYKHQAYAYLLLPRHAGLLSDARKRISAIKQYSTLGSGFKIAMRDLEIRGAGNLLGPQQSGHITAVGFELYCQLLKQSVSSLKGETLPPRLNVQVRVDFLGLDSAIPQSYVADSRQRMEIYRKLAEITDTESLQTVRAELRDRFGPIPAAVELLLIVADLKLIAASRGITAIETQDDKLMLTRNGDLITVDDKFPRLTGKSARSRLNEIKRLLKVI